MLNREPRRPVVFLRCPLPDLHRTPQCIAQLVVHLKRIKDTGQRRPNLIAHPKGHPQTRPDPILALKLKSSLRSRNQSIASRRKTLSRERHPTHHRSMHHPIHRRNHHRRVPPSTLHRNAIKHIRVNRTSESGGPMLRAKLQSSIDPSSATNRPQQHNQHRHTQNDSAHHRHRRQ